MKRIDSKSRQILFQDGRSKPMKFELIADHFKWVDRPYTSHASSKAIDKKINIKAIQTND